MWALSVRYHTTITAIVQANNLKNPNLIIVGQVLKIPVAGSSTIPDPTPTTTPTPTPTPTTTSTPDPTPTTTIITHKVVSGDTVGALARKHGTTITAIAQANNLRNVNLIIVGQVLKIPVTSSSTTPDPPSTNPDYVLHKVAPGDTVWALAIRYHTTITAIVQANDLKNPGLIIVGQTLKIPT